MELRIEMDNTNILILVDYLFRVKTDFFDGGKHGYLSGVSRIFSKIIGY